MSEITEKDNVTTDSTNNDVMDSIVTDDNADEFKMLNLLSKRNDVKNMMNTMKNEQNKLIKDVDKAEIIDERLASMSVEEVENLSYSQVEDIYTINGEKFELSISFDTHDKEMEFKKDFLVFMKKSSDTMERFDEELAKIEKEIADNQEEFDRVVSTFGNMSNLIRSKLVEKYETATDEGKKELYSLLIKEYDYGFTLDNVKDFYSTFRARNVLGDYKDDKRSNYIYRKYKKVIQSLGITTDLASFAGLEKKFLSEDHQSHPNIFIFAIISMVASWAKNTNNKNRGLFLTQFTINIKNLFYNKFDSEEERAKFIANITEVMDLID